MRPLGLLLARLVPFGPRAFTHALAKLVATGDLSLLVIRLRCAVVDGAAASGLLDLPLRADCARVVMLLDDLRIARRGCGCGDQDGKNDREHAGKSIRVVVRHAE